MKLKIMVPVDFTPVSEKALGFLNYVLEKTTAEAHLVHVIQVNEADWGGSNENSDAIDHQALKLREQNAGAQLENLKKQLNFAFTSKILYGGLTTELTRYAEENQINLIVMGTRGATGLLEKISGSEAQQVVRHTEIPVITIHEFASLAPLRQLLWVADFRKNQEPDPATETVQYLVTLFGAKVNFLQIMEPEDEAREAEIKTNMQQFAKKMDLQNYELHLRRNYQVPQVIRNFNQETEMDMVVIGTHGRSTFSQLFYGNIAETLINRCIRPLLTYHKH